MFTFRALEVISGQSRESDVCAAAGSAVCREEEGCRKPSAGVGQNVTQKGRLARPFTRQVQ